MKILICTGIFPPEAGGPATYSRTIAQEFSKLGHHVVVITYSGKSERSENQRSDLSDLSDYPIIRVIRRRFKPWHYFKYFRAVRKHGQDADVLYAQDPVSAGYPTFLAAKSLKKPYAVKITGDYSWEQAMGRGLTDRLIDEFQTFPSYPRVIAKMREIQTRVCKEATLVITPSQYLKRIVAGWGVKEKKILVIYNTTSKISKLDRENIRQSFGLQNNEQLILSIGRNVKWKGFELLEKIINNLQTQHPSLKYVFLHSADRATVEKYLVAADLFVLNTGYEGFSHVILEAMQAGLPVITTKVGGNTEIINDGENGLLVEYNNEGQIREAIIRLVQDGAMREKLRDGALETLRKQAANLLNPEFMVSETLNALKSCVS